MQSLSTVLPLPSPRTHFAPPAPPPHYELDQRVHSSRGRMEESFWDNSFTKRLFCSQHEFTEDTDLSSLSEIVFTNLAVLVQEDPEQCVYCGSLLLNQFVQLNWTGPSEEISLPFPAKCLVKWNLQSLQQLSWDNEPVYHLTRQPLLLYLAHVVLVENASLLGCRVVWWGMRCCFIQQRLLEQRSATLWDKISKQMDEELVHFMLSHPLSDLDLCELYLEMGHICLYYSQHGTAQKHFEKAQSLAKMSIELTGALGKRTRFQEKDLSQLLLKVTVTEDERGKEEEGREEEGPGESKTISSNLPRDLRLGDDTLLDQVTFTDPQTAPHLSSLQQAAVLGQCVYLQRTNPKHRLTAEETETYVNCVLAQPKCWAVQATALLLRSQLERERRRTVERAMTQLQELVDAWSRPVPKGDDRLTLLYCTPLPPRWTVEKELAAVLVSLGVVQGAVEVYQRLELWEEVATCYQAAGRRGRAEEVVRERLREHETPTLWCILGDVTQDPECYWKAWELSNHCSGRAQRSLGLFYLRKEKYEDCIKSLQLSLQINSLQENIWFSLGCAASRIGDQSLAAKAFQRCVTLEPDFPEAWSNLAAAYLRKREKVRAFHAYREALKCSFENWKIWENYLLVSADIGEFEEALGAYHRLMDLKDKFTDVEILGVLVGAVLQSVPDRSGQSAARLRKKLGELLGRITSQTTTSADVWKFYADYHLASENSDDLEKGVLELQKAQRVARQERGWEKDVTKLQRVIDFTLEYCEACRKVCEAGGRESRQRLSSARLTLQGAISKAKAAESDGVVLSSGVLEKMERELQHIVEMASELSPP